MKTDVVVIGAGMVGLAAALGFAAQGREVALIEQQSLAHGFVSDTPSARVSALTPASMQTLSNLLPEPSLFGGAEFDQMQVVDGEANGGIEFTAREVGATQLGVIAENVNVQQELLAEVNAQASIQVLDGQSRVSLESGLQHSQNQYRVVLADQAVEANLIVAADGALSATRTQLGIETREWDYPHHAVVCNLKTALPHDGVARQWFCEQGPLAFLPMPYENGHSVSIVWSCQPEWADALMKMEPEVFARHIVSASQQALGDVSLLTDRFCFPLRQRHAKRYLEKNVVLAGDAAHTIHPLAGQGANLGFADIQALLDQLLNVDLENATVLGEKLRYWQRLRMPQNLLMAGTMEGFHRLFAPVPKEVRMLRSLGLKWVNRMGPVKRALVKEAMGL